MKLKITGHLISRTTILALCLFLLAYVPVQAQKRQPVYAAYQLLKRIAPLYYGKVVFLQRVADSDFFELHSRENKLYITGNSANSMAAGLNYYLRYYCNTYVSWYRNVPVILPSKMPVVKIVVHCEARVKNRFFFNYCTFGYTMPWWQWADWQRCIDWMALNGVNMPLSITGEEGIWYKVWKNFGLSDMQIRGYFTGPAYLPWHRMANIDKWQGPLPMSWINGQVALERKIIARERELGMIPILPAFAGHVPEALKTIYPNAKINDLGKWGGFDSVYYAHFLDPFDPLFDKIQTEYLKEQTKLFGTSHIYGIDPFNEVTPPSWEPSYLASVSKSIYNSLIASDTSARWLQMSWLFYSNREKWTNERIKAYLTAVPQGKMILLDYYAENTEVWKLTDSFFGQPYLWCYLGNFGGNTMLVGNLAEAEKRMENTLVNGGSNLTGIGSTLEGFDVNPMMYEYVFEKVWSNGPTNINTWIKAWADRRAGKPTVAGETAWQMLLKNVYDKYGSLGAATLTNAKPGLTGHGGWTTNPEINYRNTDLLDAWGELLKAKGKISLPCQYDAANIGRQVLGNYFSVLRDKFTHDYEKNDPSSLQEDGKKMIQLFDDLDALLATQSSFLLGKWISDARAMGTTPEEKNYYEEDARMILTVWGGADRSLNDYANRSWAGLTKSFYKQRWQMFINAVEAAERQHKQFDEKSFMRSINNFEDNWVKQHQKFTAVPVGNGFYLSKKLYAKYALEIRAAGK